jgi:prevent-host-death family protein
VKAVGLRELKNRLSEYVRHVRSTGEGLLVTDRGEVVAELVPPGPGAADPTTSPGLLALTRKGLLIPANRTAKPSYQPLPRLLRKGRAAELLDEERGAR